MKIKSIHIENFRGFAILDLLFEKFTSLVGENGTGKTAVLEAINLDMSPAFVASRIDEQDFNNQDLGDIKIVIIFDETFIAKLPDGYATQDVPCVGVELLAKRRNQATPGKALSEEFVVTHYVMPDESVSKTQDGWISKRKNGSDFKFTVRQISFPLELDNFPRCFYFDKNRENQSKIGFNSTLQKIAQEYNWRFRKSLENNKDKFQSKWNEIYDMVISNVDEKKLKDTFVPVKTKFVNFLGKKYEGLELSILNLEQPFSKSFFSLRNGLNQIEHSNLGSGISMTLSYFLLETISNLAKEQLIILIDEPELHLHPQLQHKLQQHFKNTPLQIIISTHSEAMIDIGDWRSIKRFDEMLKCYPSQDILSMQLEYKGKSESLEKSLNDLRLYYQDRTIFFRENNEMLFARVCLLVEGPTEKYGFRVLAELAKLDYSDLTIISCNGKEKIFYYQLICKAFKIPFFTLFDEDGKDETDLDNKTLISWANGDHYYAFPRSFEHVFGTEKSEHKASATMQAIDNCKSLPKELSEAFKKIKTFLSKINIVQRKDNQEAD